jgi:major membrane immunogen (membrane-anchored lipoprotein)
MYRKFIIPFIFVISLLFLTSCGETNPLIGTWEVDTKTADNPLAALALQGSSILLTFTKTEFIVTFKDAEIGKSEITYKKEDGQWKVCDTERERCEAVPVSGDTITYTVPGFGQNLTFKRKAA